ncbi:DUF4329 domain-containing protein [Acaryochloris sp. IP29b_bin.137]|uniref:DUF4329 domain-containing protein n=1 Tax=Acaryochloris sp. IP29b_bin.137 TaxID=2969217 RepID=UPI0026078DDF|nr:DUF4329 domain-containing protein [Acaryochloris sp. IP29b_bin.137]
MTQQPKRRAKLAGLLGTTLFVLTSPIASAQHYQPTNSELEELHEVAADHLDMVQGISIREGVEYCGFFGFYPGGPLSGTSPRRGRADSCEPNNPPPGFTVLASYHTHGSYTMDADTEVPSVDDLQADIQEQIYGYVATPAGRVWFNDHERHESVMLFGPGSVFSDPNYRECQNFAPRAQYTLAQLRQRAANDPGGC